MPINPVREIGFTQDLVILASKVTAQLGGSSSDGGTVDGLYRVRKTWADAKLQKDAFKSLDNAKRCAASNPGYFVFDENGRIVGTTTSSTKTVDELAREVICGNWGNGTERKNRLTAAGYDYNAVQNRVNELLK